MEMFLTLVALSLLGTLVSAALFAAAVRDAPSEHKDKLSNARVVTAPRFFVDSTREIAPQIPVEVLLLQIERHVRLEQAAAESFVNLPTRDVLHSRTASPLVH